MKNLLVVTTSGRADVKRQETLKNLPSIITKKVIVTTKPNEVEKLKKVYKQLNIVVKKVIGVEHNTISDLRQFVMSTFKRNIIFIDDNINFHAREWSTTGKETKGLLKGINSKYFNDNKKNRIFLEMFTWIVSMLESNEYGVVGISARAGNNTAKKGVDYNSRIFAFWGVNYKLWESIGKPDMRDTKTKEDFVLQLMFLTNGIATIKNNNFAFDKCGGANSSGGCSSYRSIELMNKEAVMVKQMFPEYIEIVEKPNKRWNYENDEDGTFKDLRIKWKKAYSGDVTKLTTYTDIPVRTKGNYKK